MPAANPPGIPGEFPSIRISLATACAEESHQFSLFLRGFLRLIEAVSEGTLYSRVGGHAGLGRLVKWFYAKVRYEPEVEALFKAHVHDWPNHIRLIIEFWALMTGGPSTYGGGMGKHIFLHLREEHYAVWLAVWEQNCLELLPYREAMEMIQLAHNIGDDLRRMGNRPNPVVTGQ